MSLGYPLTTVKQIVWNAILYNILLGIHIGFMQCDRLGNLLDFGQLFKAFGNN